VGHVLHQFPEVDPPVGREVEDDLAPVEEVLGAHQLHGEGALPDPFHAERRRVGLPAGVFLVRQQVLGGRGPEHLVVNDLRILRGEALKPMDDHAQRDTPVGLDHGVVALGERHSRAVEVEDLADAPKAYPRDVHMRNSSFFAQPEEKRLQHQPLLGLGRHPGDLEERPERGVPPSRGGAGRRGQKRLPQIIVHYIRSGSG